MKHLVTMVDERCATATNPKMVPRQHIGSGTHGDTGAEGSVRKRVEQDGGVIPDTGFPRDDGMATSDNSHTVQTKGHLIQHAYVLRRSSRRLYLPRENSRAVRVRGGGS